MLPVESPFKTYTGLDGKPLHNGFVYFGLPNQNPITAPVTVYWDVAGTIPAAQPLRTINGYISRAGTPANVFFDGSYSTLIKDSKGRTVFYSRTSSDFSTGPLINEFKQSLDMLEALFEATANSIAILRALNSPFYKSVHVLGYYAPGDGGGGTYYLDAADKSTFDNGGTVIVSVDGNRWKLASTTTVSIKQFGAKGDGTTGDSVAINAALACGARLVRAPFSAAGYVIDQMVTVPNFVTLTADDSRTPVGAFAASGRTDDCGVTFLVTATTGDAAMFLGGNVSLSGIRFFYPNQTDTNPPVTYPPTIVGKFGTYDTTVRNCSIVNAYDGIRFINNHGRIRIKDCVIWAYNVGLDMDKHYDVSFVDSVNMWPIVAGTSSAAGSAYEYMLQNGIGLRCKRLDHLMVTNFFCIFKKIGIHLTSSTDGTTYGAFTNVGLESCITNVLIDAVNSENGISFVNSKFCVSAGAPLITAGANVAWNNGVGRVHFNGCNFWGALVQNHINMTVSGAQLLVANTTFTGGLSGTDGSHIKLTSAPVVSITGSSFGPHPVKNIDLNGLTHDVILSNNIVPAGGLVVFNPNTRALLGSATNMPA